MPKPKQPGRPRTTDEILREMENVSKGIGSDPDDAHGAGSSEAHGGGLKSLLNFFVKVVPEEELQGAVPSADPKSQAIKTRVADLVAREPAPSFSAPPPQTGDPSSKPFEEIYKEAGIAESACSADELARLLENPAVANQP